MERFLFCQRFQIARKAQLPEAKGTLQTGDELAPKATAQPQVWSTLRKPISAPRCLGSAAICSSVLELARKRRS